MHFPAVRAATRSHLNPCAENFAMYHGFSPALRSKTRPPIFIALLIARISCIQTVEYRMQSVTVVDGHTLRLRQRSANCKLRTAY